MTNMETLAFYGLLTLEWRPHGFIAQEEVFEQGLMIAQYYNMPVRVTTDNLYIFILPSDTIELVQNRLQEIKKAYEDHAAQMMQNVMAQMRTSDPNIRH